MTDDDKVTVIRSCENIDETLQECMHYCEARNSLFMINKIRDAQDSLGELKEALGLGNE